MDLSFLQKNYLLVILSILLTVFVIFISNLIAPQKDEEKVYKKAIISSLLVSIAIVYVHNMTPYIEEIISSPPPF
jgi:uncharacterized membrane protein